MTVANPIPARMRGLNRAEICDVNFQEFVRGWNGHAQPKPAPDEAILDGSALAAKLSAESMIGSMPGSLRKRSAMKPPLR